jgi:hypothetical protein
MPNNNDRGEIGMTRRNAGSPIQRDSGYDARGFVTVWVSAAYITSNAVARGQEGEQELYKRR